MPSFLENYAGNGVGGVVGDPSILGILFIGFFSAFVMLQDTRLDGKLVVLVPVLILATVFIPWLSVLIALGLGAIVYIALMKLINH